MSTNRMSLEEAMVLLKRRDHGDKRAVEEIVCRNTGLARAYAARWRASGLPFDELYQLALIGLWEAAQGWDPAKGTLGTFACWKMRAQLQRGVFTERQVVHLPVFARDQIPRIAAYIERGGVMEIEPLTAYLNTCGYKHEITRSTVRAILNHMRGALSLDAHYGDGDTQLHDLLAAQNAEPDEAIDTETRHEHLYRALGCLTPRMRWVIVLRFSDGLTLKETGQRIGGISRERVRQMEVQALKRLRAYVGTGRKPPRVEDVRPSSDPCWQRLGDAVLGAIDRGLQDYPRLLIWARRRETNMPNPSGQYLKHTLAWLHLQGRIGMTNDRYFVRWENAE